MWCMRDRSQNYNMASSRRRGRCLLVLSFYGCRIREAGDTSVFNFENEKRYIMS